MEESLREEVADTAHTEAPEMMGQAPAMQDVFRAIGRLSQSHVTVLVTGESGSGKELVARALHKHSPRASGPFVAINTAAIPKELLESELFGHERGAFTGAQGQRRGRFEQADGGTLFLDEIGDMPFELQTRLLRVLSEGSFYRVGGHTSVKSNVRVIAATHQDLEERVKLGLFREDLLHRLNVIRLRLPALRERREDVAPLTRHFLQLSAHQLGVEVKRISDAALGVLEAFPVSGQCAPTRKHLPLVDGDGALAIDRTQRLAAGSAVGLWSGWWRARCSAACHLDCAACGVLHRHRFGCTRFRCAARADRYRAAACSRSIPGSSIWSTRLWNLLQADCSDVWDVLTRRFESRLDPRGTANHPGSPGGRGQPAGHWPQHHHPQNPGVGAGPASRAGGRHLIGLSPGSISPVRGRWGARSCGVPCRSRRRAP